MKQNHTKKNNEHFLDKLNAFIKNEISPNIDMWEKKESYPQKLHQKAASYGLFQKPYESLTEDQDPEHVSILCDKLCRHGSQGLAVALTSFFPVLSILHKHRSHDFCASVIKQVLTGKAIISLAVTEPHAGSDINAINTKIQPSQKRMVINGEKSLICNADKAKYLLILTKHLGELSLVLFEKPAGIESTRMPTLGWKSLPVNHLRFCNSSTNNFYILGVKNNCKKELYQSFNYERLNMATLACASAKSAFNQAVKHAKQRSSFGKPLIKHQVIRHKLSMMKANVIAMSTLLQEAIKKKSKLFESTSYFIPIVKNFCVQTSQQVIDDALQIIGGQACVQGHAVERLYRDSRILRIGGGTDEMMNEIIAHGIENETKN